MDIRDAYNKIVKARRNGRQFQIKNDDIILRKELCYPKNYKPVDEINNFLNQGGSSLFQMAKISDYKGINESYFNLKIQHPVNGNTIAHYNINIVNHVHCKVDDLKFLLNTENFDGKTAIDYEIYRKE